MAFVAVCLLALISQTALGAPHVPWLVRPTKGETTMSTIVPTTVVPTTLAPTPSIAALETTPVVVPVETKAPTTLAPVPVTSTLAPQVVTSTLAGSVPPQPSPTTMVVPVETTSIKVIQPETLAPTMIVETIAPETKAPEILTTEASATVVPVETKASKPTKLTTAPPTLPPIDFDCRKKNDGYYVDSKDKCSSKYFACVGGQGRQLDCGTLVYEPETKSCERREESYRCTGTRKTTMPTTPRRPTAEPLKDIDCSKLDDGWYPDTKAKCSHTFYSCSNRLGSKFECPGHMYFDVETKACQSYQDVVACAGKKRPTKKPKPSTKAPPKEKLPIDCSILASGQYADPTKKCSNIYFVCSNGDGVKRACPEGLFFDPKKLLCDWYDDIFACTGKRKPATTAAPPKPSVAALPPPEYNCAGKDDGQYLPPGKKCSSIYYRCVGHVSYKLVCPDDLYYDMKNDLCDRFDDLYECSGKYKTSPLPVTTQKAPTTEKLPIDCSKYPDGNFPDPEKKCSSNYYSCSGLVGSRRLCPSGTFFDKDFGICDILENVPDCNNGRRPKTPKPTKAPIQRVTKSPYDCQRREDGNYQAGKCNSKYWSCVGGSTYKANCPHGTYFDAEMNECGYKEEIPACGGKRRSTLKP